MTTKTSPSGTDLFGLNGSLPCLSKVPALQKLVDQGAAHLVQTKPFSIKIYYTKVVITNYGKVGNAKNSF